jgi:hypothetical protein
VWLASLVKGTHDVVDGGLLRFLMESTATLEGAAGHKAIKKLYPRLTRAVIRGDIPARLYSEELIGDEVLEIAISDHHTSARRGMRVVRELQDSVNLNPSGFSTLVEILSEEEVTKELASALEGTQ